MDLEEIKKLIEDEGGKIIIVEQGRPVMVITSFEAYQKKKASPEGGAAPTGEPRQGREPRPEKSGREKPAVEETAGEELKIEDLPF